MEFKKRKQITVDYLCDLEEKIEGYHIINISISSNYGYYVLAVDKAPDDLVIGPVLYNYKVLILQWENVIEINIHNQKLNYHFVQALEDKLLLVCSRAKYHGKNNYDLNGRVFNYNGNIIKEFLLGDGINDIKVTEKNNIWTSYFDEGVLGNNGWSHPIGSNGLRAWSKDGESVYEFYNNDLSQFIILDCYALNVINDEEVWFYYYPVFFLARMKRFKLTYYDPKLAGSDGFIVYKDNILFRGGYEDHDIYQLYKFQNKKLIKIEEIEFLDDNGKRIIADNLDYRGNQLLLRVKTKLYVINLKDKATFLL